MPNELSEVNSLCNDQYLLCLKNDNYEMFKDRKLVLPSNILSSLVSKLIHGSLNPPHL